MNRDNVYKVYEVVENTIKSKEDKDYYVFGFNSPSDKIIFYLQQRGYNVCGLLDNNIKNQGKKYMGVPIDLPEKFLGKYNEKAIIFIQSIHYLQMSKQLIDMGYVENDNIIKTINFDKNIEETPSQGAIEEYLNKMREGFKIYKKHILDEKTLALVAPLNSIGDIYILCSYLTTYLSRCKEKKAFLFVKNETIKRITNMFQPFQNCQVDVVVATDSELESLSLLARYFQYNVRIMQPYCRDRLIHNYDGYKGITFFDQYRIGLLGLYNNTKIKGNNIDLKPAIPNFPKENRRVDSFFEEYNINPKKTIILSPYAYSLPLLDITFWEELSKELIDAGFDVVTNCGNSKEIPISGTNGVFFEFEDAVKILNRCKAFIACRNGLCELVSQSQCQKIHLYSDKHVGNLSAEEFYEDELFFKNTISFTLTTVNKDTVISEILAELY